MKKDDAIFNCCGIATEITGGDMEYKRGERFGLSLSPEP